MRSSEKEIEKAKNKKLHIVKQKVSYEEKKNTVETERRAKIKKFKRFFFLLSD